MVVFACDFWVFIAHFYEGSHPEVVCEGEDVCFGHESEFVLIVSCFAGFEGVSDAAFYAHACGNHLLGCYFVRCVFAEESADAAVEIFGVFSDD